MSDKTGIQWTDSTWTPIRARVKENAVEIADAKGYDSLLPILKPGKVGPHCEHASQGCNNCYSETNNGRCLPSNGTGLPFDRRARDLVDIFLDEKILVQPLHWNKPRKIFVCSQTDLFGEWVPDELIDRVFAVMQHAQARGHVFQVLTKRAGRMRDYFDDSTLYGRWLVAVDKFRVQWSGLPITPLSDPLRFPLPNVWLGVSDEGNQHQRIDILRQTPAAVRFVSFEPLIYDPGEVNLKGIQWAIPGGESGPKARPCNLEWIFSLVQQATASGVACFVKQYGAKPMYYGERFPLKSRSGSDMSEWSSEMQVREFPQ